MLMVNLKHVCKIVISRIVPFFGRDQIVLCDMISGYFHILQYYFCIFIKKKYIYIDEEKK